MHYYGAMRSKFIDILIKKIFIHLIIIERGHYGFF